MTKRPVDWSRCKYRWMIRRRGITLIAAIILVLVLGVVLFLSLVVTLP